MMRQFGIGAGLRKSGLGLQRHYEIILELAPKCGGRSTCRWPSSGSQSRWGALRQAA